MKITLNKCFLFLVALSLDLIFAETNAKAQNPVPDEALWGTNGTVNALVKDPASNTLYIGGEFTSLFKKTPFGVGFNSGTSSTLQNYSKPNGTVKSCSPDGSGGWFIGGDFTMVGGQLRNHIAQLNSNGQVTSWDPDVDGVVNCIIVRAGKALIGGSFTTVGAQPRSNLAAIDVTSGVATSWNPSATSSVNQMCIKGNTLYVYGGFSGGVGMVNIVSGSSSTLSFTATGGSVYTIYVDSPSNTLYIAGYFNAINGQTRDHIAALDASSGVLKSWTPAFGSDPNNPITAIVRKSNTIYVGGNFSTLGGQTRRGLGAFDATTGGVVSWNPHLNNTNGGTVAVNSLSVIGGTVYIGGRFDSLGGVFRRSFGIVNATTGIATSFDAGLDFGGQPEIFGVATSGQKIYLGGDFFGVNAVARPYLGAIDVSTGVPTTWNPRPNNVVSALAIKGGTIYAGGAFTTVGTQARNNIAAIDAGGVLSPWNPAPASGVFGVTTLAIKGATIYIGGFFNSMGGATRKNLAAVDEVSGLATAWNPNPNDGVLTICIADDILYAGGYFSVIGGQSRNSIAALSLNTAIATSWDPNSDGPIDAVVVVDDKVYAGGVFFSSIGGQSRIGIAELDKNSGLATSWDPLLNSSYVTSIAITGNTVYVGGNFNTVGGQPHKKIVALERLSGNPLSWNPNLNSVVKQILISDNHVFVGGGFTTIGGQSTPRLASFSCASPPTKPGAITQSGGAAKICSGETRTYSIAAVSGASYYKWIVPTGATIVSGQGTASAVVAFDNSFAASDTIKVNAQNECNGMSDYRIKVVSKGTAPAIPAAITGENYGLCSQSGVAYSTTNTPDITYGWAFSNANGTIAAGQGASSITADFTPGAATSTLSVTATNGCGTSAPRNKTIYAKPLTPGSVSGPAAVCAHDNGVAYSTSAVYGADTYTWKAPAGSHVSDGVTTSTGTSLTTSSNSVTVNFGATAGNVQVRANNTCGSSGYFFKPVSMNCRTINGVEEAIGSGDVTVYPNPAADQVSLNFKADKAGEYTVRLYDVIGKEVMTVSGNALAGQNQAQLNTTGLASGVYHLVLKGEGFDYNTKVVLEK